MKNVLFICGRIDSAVGKIASNLAYEMQKRHNVVFISLKTKDVEYANLKHDYSFYSHVYYYDQLKNIKETHTGIISKVFELFTIAYERKFEERFFGLGPQIDRYIRKCRRIIKTHHIDSIITFYMPFETLDIGYVLKRDNPQIEWLPYLFDCFDFQTQSAKLEQYFNLVHHIAVSPWLINQNEFYRVYSNKLKIMEIPCFDWNNFPTNPSTEYATFLYAGAFYEGIRNPLHLFDLFRRFEIKWQLQLFPSGCESIIEENAKLFGDSLIVNKLVSENELHRKMANSNIILAIGNTNITQVPSKIYDIIAGGKPLIYFFQNENDIAIEVLKKYPLALVVEYSQAASEAKSIQEWIVQNKNKVTTYVETIKNMPYNHPEYIVKEIEHCFEA